MRRKIYIGLLVLGLLFLFEAVHTVLWELDYRQDYMRHGLCSVGVQPPATNAGLIISSMIPILILLTASPLSRHFTRRFKANSPDS